MAANERVFYPKQANINHAVLTEAGTSPGAPGIVWKAGADGGKLYKAFLIYHNGNVGATAVFNLYWSPDGVTFTLIKTDSILVVGADVPIVLFTDFLTDFFRTDYRVDTAGEKYIDVPPNGGLFVDITSNALATATVRSYGVDF